MSYEFFKKSIKKAQFFLFSLDLALLVSLFPVFFVSAKNNSGKDFCWFYHILSEALRLHQAYVAFRNYNIYLRKINVDALQ